MFCPGVAAPPMPPEVVRDLSEWLRPFSAPQTTSNDPARKLAELHQHLDRLPLAIVVWDERFRVARWSLRAEELFGWAAHEVVGKHPSEWAFFPDRDTDAVADAMRDLLAGRQVSSSIRQTSLRRDGAPLVCEWFNSALHDPEGRLVSVLSSILDVTELETAQRALAKEELRFRATFEQAAVGIAHVAFDGSVLRANRRLCEMLGYARHEMSRTRLQDLTHADDRAQDWDRLAELTAGKIESYRTDKRYVASDGSSVWCELTVSLARTSAGDPDYFIAVVAEATRRKAAEIERDRLLRDECDARAAAEEASENRAVELAEARRRLAQAENLAALGQLAAGIGHEINNPLAYMLANLTYAIEGLQSCSPPNEELEHHVADILESLRDAQGGAEKIRDVVADLRTFADGESDQGLVDLHDVLETALGLVDDRLRAKARIARVYDPVGRVRAHAEKLVQAFVNILLNAADAIPPGAPQEQRVEVDTFTKNSGQAVVRIRDTGSGMPSRVVARIFEPYFTTKAPGEGLGLGMAVSYNTLRSLGGTIEVDSAPGQGTTVRVVLPATEALSTVARPSFIPASVGRRMLSMPPNPSTSLTLGDGHSMDPERLPES